jgi:hypothetical protein
VKSVPGMLGTGGRNREQTVLRGLLISIMVMVLPGCAVVAVADAAVSVAAGAVGLAADAAVGTAKIVGKGVGKAADAMLGGDGE